MQVVGALKPCGQRDAELKQGVLPYGQRVVLFRLWQHNAALLVSYFKYPDGGQ